jgi:hypothetical protein
MSTNTVTIRFAGICTHFRDIVPAVPHRVVLPNATAIRFGLIHLDWSGETVAYYLTPHFPFLRTPKNVEHLDVPDVMEGGYFYACAGLKVLNAVDDALTYAPSFDQTPPITSFVSHYSFSDDVLGGGRAACYFDLSAGKVRSETVPGGATQVVIEIQTDGPPMLSITPFRSTAPATTLTLDSDELLVANLEIDRQDADPPFDYLLHYLTDRTGIPTRLTQPTPGMGPTPPSSTQESVAKALHGLARVVASGKPTPQQLASINPNDIGPSCADTRYP